MRRSSGSIQLTGMKVRVTKATIDRRGKGKGTRDGGWTATKNETLAGVFFGVVVDFSNWPLPDLLVDCYNGLILFPSAYNRSLPKGKWRELKRDVVYLLPMERDSTVDARSKQRVSRHVDSHERVLRSYSSTLIFRHFLQRAAAPGGSATVSSKR